MLPHQDRDHSAKFLVIAAWELTLTGYAYVISLATGALSAAWTVAAASLGTDFCGATHHRVHDYRSQHGVVRRQHRTRLTSLQSAPHRHRRPRAIIAAIGYGQYFPWSVIRHRSVA